MIQMRLLLIDVDDVFRVVADSGRSGDHDRGNSGFEQLIDKRLQHRELLV